MSYRPDDKSAPTTYCTTSASHSPGEPDGHINPSAPDEARKSLGGRQRLHSTSSTIPRSNVLVIPPRRIALCGGGVRGVAHVGVMKCLRDYGLLPTIKEVMGISAGSLFALLWVLEYTVEEIERLALSFDFTLLQRLDPDSFFSFPQTFGLDDGSGLQKFLESILRQKGFSAAATFAEVAARHPIHLRCFATELQTRRIRQFGTLATPDVSVLFALRASMSLPFLFTPVQDPHSNTLLTDGGVLHNLPLVFLTPSEVQETWGVLFSPGVVHSVKPIADVIEYCKNIYENVVHMRSELFLQNHPGRVICVPVRETGALNFKESRENREKMIQIAYTATERFLEGKWMPVPARRFSAA